MRSIVKMIILGVLMFAVMFSVACNINSPENSVSDNSSTKEIVEKPFGSPFIPIPREKWPTPPHLSGPPADLDMPHPKVSGNVVKIDSQNVSFGTGGRAHLFLFVNNATSADLGKFNLRITFDPKVISTDIESAGNHLYEAKLDNTLGAVELSVNPYPFPRNVVSGWIDLGLLLFTAIGKPGDSTDLHLTITSQTKNLTTIDGVVTIR